MTETEVEVMHPQANECKQLEKARGQFPPQHLQEECISANTLILAE